MDPAILGLLSWHIHLSIADNSDNENINPVQMLVGEISDGLGEWIVSMRPLYGLAISTAALI